MRVAVRKNWERIGEVNALVEQNLSGIRSVKALANEDLEREKSAQGNDRFLGSRKDIYRNEA